VEGQGKSTAAAVFGKALEVCGYEVAYDDDPVVEKYQEDLLKRHGSIDNVPIAEGSKVRIFSR
jgi:hypothetical protein